MEQNCELGDFLRSRRARLRPEGAGAAFSGGVRRVPGLRREEVAHLAGVSTDYYARLEQGRHPHVSETVLEAVARALRLDDTERCYLFELAQPKSPGPSRRPAARAPRVRPAVHQMLDALDSVSPALVLNHRTDILAGNRSRWASSAGHSLGPRPTRGRGTRTALRPVSAGGHCS
ncbi:helix-turn-helix domain-containing protein [Streptomyces sp. NPDC058690]|uniref:helix-turn-helix domain-containing protein n=1 Tax=Streptomyces sp. NPDC058690 TaxID=3346600 RepID=UPI00364DBC34